jgi:thiamine pyrophosphate-dependent acetolactate synthase large subunit-like protein
VVVLMGGGSMHYAITALWTAAHYRVPVTIVVASNAECEAAAFLIGDPWDPSEHDG